jgi:hypothetical protein
MNARQKLHQVNLTNWAARFKEQAASGLTVKEWCSQNNLSIHTYNYWKHALKEECVDSLLPDIVPINLPQFSPAAYSQTQAQLYSLESCDSHEQLHSVCITIGDIRVEIGPSASDEMITGIIKAVRHA